MQITALLASLALTASTTTALILPIFTPTPSQMVANNYDSAVKCAAKNPQMNTLISSYCGHNSGSGLTIGGPFTRQGLLYDGYRALITGPNCPADNKFVPFKYCMAQFQYMCANVGGPKGAEATMHFGKNGCQTWKLINCAKEGGCHPL